MLPGGRAFAVGDVLTPAFAQAPLIGAFCA